MEKPHKKLEAWKQSIDLAIGVYGATAAFPKEELYGLTNQARRAVVSISSNIAEGAARQTKREFLNFLHIAQGSLSELDSQLELARRLGFLSESSWRELDSRMLQIDKMLTGLIRHVGRK
ncbi:MAG: four helix bundle protein [Deltaproteobacteria bacterium]|nr:four helix bundle protein [Deltaproteobacteria bacterium]